MHLRRCSVQHDDGTIDKGDANAKVIGGHSTEKVRGSIKKLSDAFTHENGNKMDITTYSGVPKHIGEKLRKGGTGGKHFIPGFTSTSYGDKDTPLDFARTFAVKDKTKEHHIMRFHVPASKPGGHAQAMSVVQHSDYSENEILLHHGLHVQYEGTKTVPHPTEPGDTLHIHTVRVLPGHTPLENYKDQK